MDWSVVMSSAALVLVAVIEAVSLRERGRARQEKERAERRAALRERESHLSMELTASACALALVTAKKMTGMHTNGDVEQAMERAGSAQRNYQNFLEETAAKQLARQ